MKRLSCFLLLAALPHLATAARTITHEDVWLMKRLGNPAVSPDGKWVVVSVSEPAYDEKDQASDLWIVPADGSARARKLTASKSAESSVAWSPDSRRIVFSARREGDEAAQLYVMDVAGGGEAARITQVWGGASSPKWSPDGKQVLFSSTVYPGAKTDEDNRKRDKDAKARKYNARVYDSFPIRYWDRWLDEKKASLFVQAVEAGALATDILAQSKIAASAGFSGVMGDSGEEMRGVWSPDGKGVVFAATTDRNRSAYAFTHQHLFQAPVPGGELKQLTQGEDRYTNPQFSADGKTLFALAEAAGDGMSYHLDRLVRFGWPSLADGSAARTVVTPKFDRSVSDYSVTPDGATAWLIAEEHGNDKLFRVPAAGGEVTEAKGKGGVLSGLDIASKSGTIVAKWESAVSPPEVALIAESGPRQLTGFNTARAHDIDWAPVRHFWFTSTRGRKIHNLLVTPPGFDEKKKYPLFVVIHGGPASQWKDQFVIRWNYHLLAAPGYVLLLTNYSGSTGFGETFAQSIQGDPLAGPAQELIEAADHAIKTYPFIDASRQAAGGASYGGHLANWLEATTTRFKCLISHAGLVNLESQWGTSDGIYHREVANAGPVWEQGPVWKEQNPIRKAMKFKTPILVTVGERDFRVPLNNSLENWSVLQRMQVPSKLIVFPEENHWVLKGENSRFFYQEVQAWLKKWL